MKKTTCSARLSPRAIRLTFIIGLLVFCFCIVILASVPPVSRDALTHHLAVPKLYLDHGGIYEIPELIFSYYPMNLDLLYLLPLSVGNDVIPKYIHFTFALLTSLLIYSYLKNRIGEIWGLFGSLFFLSIPVIIKLSITVYVDLGLIFFTTASLLLLFRWAEHGYRLLDLSFAALCCGLAVGTKYNGLISLLLLTSFTPIIYARSMAGRPGNLAMIRYGFIFLFIALAAASPWFIRNFIWTGNPLFPLFQNIFNPGQRQAASAGFDIFTVRRLVFSESTWQILFLPVRIFFEGQDNNAQYFDGRLNPFLFILPFFSFAGQRTNQILRTERGFLLLFCILYFLFTLFQSNMRIRYISPIIPFLVILSILGLHNLAHNASKKLRTLHLQITVTLLAIMALSYNIIYMAETFHQVQPLAYLSGKISRDEYITRYRPEYPVIQSANREPGQKTLCLFMGNRGYYMNFPHVFDLPFSRKSFFSSLVSTADEAEYLQQELQKRGFQRILLRNDLTVSWLGNLKEHKEIVTFFFQHSVQLVYSLNGYSLFRIKPHAHRSGHNKQ